MKRKFFLPFVALMCAVFMVSCGGGGSKKSGGSSSDKTTYLKVLPSNAFAIMKVDLGNVLDKSEILENVVVKAAFENSIANAPQKIQDLLNKIYNDPTKSGVDVNSPVYAAVTGVEPVSIVMTIAMDNVNAFEKTLSTISEGEFRSVEKNGMKFVSTGENEIEVAYDNDKIVFAFNENRAYVSEYTTLAQDRMAVNDKRFAGIFNGDDDAKLIIRLEPVLDEMLRAGVVESELKPLIPMLKEVALTAALNFEKGFVALDAELTLPAEVKELVNKVIQKPSKRHFGYIPENSFAVLNYNFDMAQLYPVLEATGMLANIQNSYGVNSQQVKSLLQALSGDYTAAMWFNGDDFEDVQFMAAIDCSDRSLFDLLSAYIAYEMDAVAVDNDVYALNVNRKERFDYYTYESEYYREGYDYYLMYKNGAVMLMPENLYEEMTRNGEFTSLRNSVLDNKTFSSMSENLVIDVKPVRNLVADKVRDSYYPSQDDKTVLEVLNLLNSLRIDFNISNLGVRLNLNDKSANSLKVFFDKVLSIAMQYEMSGNDEYESYPDYCE